MKKIRYTILMCLLALPSLASAQSIPDFPMAFWGNVTINGSPAPVGTAIRAYYGSTLAGSVTVQEAGIYGYTQPTKQKLVVAEGAGTLTFKIQSIDFNGAAETTGDTPQTYSGFAAGLTVQQDLAFTIATPSASSGSSSSSGGGAGGGGGGGSTSAAQNQSATSSKADANGDGKTDLLDFNSLLIQWGKTGTSFTSDFNKDGVVDILDFNLLLINWSK